MSFRQFYCLCVSCISWAWLTPGSLLCCLSLLSLFLFNVVAGWSTTHLCSLKHLSCCMYMYCSLVHGFPFRFGTATKMLWKSPAASSVILCAKLKTCRSSKTSQLLGQGTTIWYITEHQWVVSLAFIVQIMWRIKWTWNKKLKCQKDFKF